MKKFDEVRILAVENGYVLTNYSRTASIYTQYAFQSIEALNKWLIENMSDRPKKCEHELVTIASPVGEKPEFIRVQKCVKCGVVFA